jgi:hypothetical protein
MTAAEAMSRLGGFLEKCRPNFWLLRAAFALGSGLCFVIFKFVTPPSSKRIPRNE